MQRRRKDGARQRTGSEPVEDYDGLLAEPMRVPHLLATPEEKSAWVVDQVTKTILLFEHFRIDPNGENPWRDLAMALARKACSGVRATAKTAGTPKTAWR